MPRVCPPTLIARFESRALTAGPEAGSISPRFLRHRAACAASRAEYPLASAATRCSLQGDTMPIRSLRSIVKKRAPIVAPSITTVVEAARLMKHHNVGALLVVDHTRLIGIFT